jgi:cobyrinic acid a,c-diamide synthase
LYVSQEAYVSAMIYSYHDPWLSTIERVYSHYHDAVSILVNIVLESKQIEFKRLMMAAVMVTLPRGDQLRSHNFHMSSMQVN